MKSDDQSQERTADVRAAFNAAEEERKPGMNDLWPWWVYPGPSMIERSIPSLPLSKDRDREHVLQR
jgi:hypothetical protein